MPFDTRLRMSGVRPQSSLFNPTSPHGGGGGGVAGRAAGLARCPEPARAQRGAGAPPLHLVLLRRHDALPVCRSGLYRDPAAALLPAERRDGI